MTTDPRSFASTRRTMSLSMSMPKVRAISCAMRGQANAGIAALELDDCVDEFLRWPLWAAIHLDFGFRTVQETTKNSKGSHLENPVRPDAPGHPIQAIRGPIAAMLRYHWL
jgi:hypothetical protein